MFKSSVLLAAMLVTQMGCASGPKEGTTLTRAEESKIISDLKTPTTQDKIRVITDAPFEVPDPTRPELIEFPDHSKKYVLGFSGQNFMVVDSLEDLVKGGIKSVRKVELTNEHGFPYGGEIDPATGKPFGYAFDSSTWDVSVFKYPKTDGTLGLKVLAGAMASGPDGHPYLIRDGWNNTRQRLFFDAEFRDVNGQYELFATSPKAILNKALPKEGNWIETDARGKVIFSHGYGGEPVTLQNGDLFVDERGFVPFVHETVVEQKNVTEPDGTVKKIPYRTAIVVTYLDRTLSKVMVTDKIIFDVYRPDGSIWAAANRPTAGPLVEGPHIEVQHNGKAIESMAEVRALRKAKTPLDFQMLFSAGEYFGHYGSYMAFSQNGLENMRPVLDDSGELYDVTAPLRVLFTWIGRPVSFHANGKDYLLIHGVDRSSLPEGITLDQLPKENEWQYFRRQEIVVPVERVMEKGLPKLKIKDDGGLIELLKKYTPRKVSFMIRSYAQAA